MEDRPAVSDNVKTGEIVEAVIFKITDFGAFCNLKNNRRGLIHISQISNEFVKEISDYVKVGDKLTARIIRVTPDGKIDLTLKNIEAPPEAPAANSLFNASFEEKLKKFIRRSEEKISDLQKHVESKQK